MTFQKGHKGYKYWLGKKRPSPSQETREKLSNALKGRTPIRNYEPFTEERKKKSSQIAKENNFGKWMIGKKLSEETKRKISENHKGKVPKNIKIFQESAWKKNKGKKHTEGHKRKISNTLKGRNFGYKFSKGKEHPFWKGGISYEPYSLDWTQTLKRAIRERDNYICQLCSQYGNIIHHIDYNKRNCNPDNLITLCGKCHIKTNHNREYWTEYFMTITQAD